MDQSQTETLRENRVTIVQDLEPNGTVLDSLYEDGILTENDVELVSSARTRKERVQTLLSILPTRGPVAYGSFQRALEVGQFEDLAKLLAPITNNDNQQNDLFTSSFCQPCGKFHKRLENNPQKTSRLKKLLHWNCCLFLDNIEPKDVMDQLFQDHVINNNDIDKITSCTTRRDRCETLFEILLENSDNSVTNSLKGALMKKYSYIVDKVYNFEKEIENRQTEPYEEENKRTGFENTQLKNVYDDNLNGNSWYRDVDERTARIFTESTELVKTNGIKVVAAGKAITNMTQSGMEIRCASIVFDDSELTSKTDDETELKERIDNKSNEAFDYRNSHVVKSENVEKTCVHEKERNGTNSIREIEERTASTFSEISTDETEAKVVVFSESNKQSAVEHDSAELTNTLDENGEIKHDKCTCCTQNIASTKVKIPSSQSSYHLADSVDGTIYDRRLQVTVLDKTVIPIKSKTAVEKDNNNMSTRQCLTSATSVINNTRVNEQADSLSSTYQQRQTTNDTTSKKKELLPISVTAIHTEKPRKRLTVAFNYLSTLINQGEFAKFQDISCRLQQQFPTNYDLMCIIGYLQISRDLFQTNFDSAKKKIDDTMALVTKSSNPRYFTLELFTAKTRMYITRKKLEKLQTTLDEAMMILETDPVGCTGRAAGWLYINHARNQTAQLSCLNLRKRGALSTYEHLFQSAKSSFQRSMSNFKRDGGKDGPFGFGYALCRLVILLLRCGDNGLTMDALTPPSDDLRSAGDYLQHLEDSDIVISKILDMHFRLAKSDYQFRRHNCIRAFEHAQIAYDLATEMSLLEFKEHAHNRLAHLRSRTATVISVDEMSSAEAEQILFGDSSDDNYSTQSE